ncbi:MAG TPA: ABC transporter permease [Vicinamibacterales bacterium]|nr:ABC transporter permease [Vicinamibacterales bacterium]
MSGLAFDLKDLVRGLVRTPAYAVTVIATLALTIGATAAIFSIVDHVLLEPLAYREPQRLVWLREIWRQANERNAAFEVNERHFEYWRAHARSFESMAQFFARPADLTGPADAVPIVVVRASGTLFDVLGTKPALGRLLTAADEPSGAEEVIVVTDALWHDRLGADPAAIGRPLVVDGRPRTVVGVLPVGFQLPETGGLSGRFDAVMPLHMDAETVGWTGDHNNNAVARLAPGVTADAATAELDVLQRQVGTIATAEAHETVTLASRVLPLTDTVVGRSRRGLVLLFAAVVAVLLIACSNVANLSLTRTLNRLRETAIRSALGASRGRLVWRAAGEALLLAAAGGALGIWLAWLGLAVFVRTAPLDLPRAAGVTLDARVVLFTALVSAVTGVVVAALPVWRLAVRDVEAALRAGSSAVTGDRAGRRARSGLVALQVGLTVALLVVTSLVGLSLVRVMRLDRGFDADRVLAVSVMLPPTRYAAPASQLDVYDRLLAAVQAQPGVSYATTTSMLPLAGSGQVNFIVADGSRRPIFEQPSANFRFVAPAFFRTLGISILRGRSFTADERDPAQPAPVVVSQPLAERLWPGEDALGKLFSRGYQQEQGFVVVGVVADVRMTSVEGTPPLMVYVPYWWRTRASTSLLVRTAGEPAALMPAVRRAVRAIDPEIALGDARPLTAMVDRSMAPRLYQTRLFVAFGLAALFIALVGVYAVTAYSLSRRRRELNIRVALGASRPQVLGMVLGQGALPLAAGIAGGVAAALAAGRFVAALLFGVQPHDPIVVSGVAVLVGIAGVAASFAAARHALAIDPAGALRDF